MKTLIFPRVMEKDLTVFNGLPVKNKSDLSLGNVSKLLNNNNMTQVLITDDKSKQVQSVFEFRHNWKYVSNRAYAINAVEKAINKNQLTIVLDPSKLKQKKYISTEVFLFDRHGEQLKVEVDKDYNFSMVVSGQSWPQHGDRFCFAEGRKYALIDAIKQLKFTSNDPNYKDLLSLKLFLQQFEIKAKEKYFYWKWPNVLITWQYIDLWNALLTAKSFSGSKVFDIKGTVEKAAIELVGQVNYDNLFAEYVKEFITTFTESDSFDPKDENFCIEDAYHYYSWTIAEYYKELNESKSTVSQLSKKLEDEI